MAISNKLPAVLLLLITLFSVLSLSAALPVTTDLALRDCKHIRGGSGCATFDNTALTRDTKATDADGLDSFQPELTHLKRAIPKGATVTCDSVTAPISKAAVRSNFVDKYCSRIDGEVFRKSGIEEVCTELITTMYMFVETINGDWIYVNEKFRCVGTFDVIMDTCSDDKTFVRTCRYPDRGGTLKYDHVQYNLKVFKFGGMSGKEPHCLNGN